MPFAFHYAARSDVGMVRSENQDSGYAGPRLLAMADGMGGHAGGDIASSTVIGALVDLDGEALGSSEASSALLQRITAANEQLAEIAKAEPALHGMGTTLIAILRSHNKLVLAHIGDSRAYLARDGKLTQITKDHSFVQSLVDEGRITEDEAIGHPQRSLVTRVLTGQDDDEPDITVREARIGDRYLIASDGLTDYVAGDTIAELVLAGETPGPTADRLVDLALKAGAPDNVTIVIGDVVDLTKVTAPPTQPQIVGAAATRTKGTRPIPVTPAAKAAALSREAAGKSEDDDGDVTLAEEGPASGRRSGCVAWPSSAWSSSCSAVVPTLPTPGHSGSSSWGPTTATSPSTKGFRRTSGPSSCPTSSPSPTSRWTTCPTSTAPRSRTACRPTPSGTPRRS